MSLRSRLDRLERVKTDSDAYGVDWLEAGKQVDSTGSTDGLMDWVKRHGFSDPLAALRAGCRGYVFELDCLSWWLVGHGYRPAYSRGAGQAAAAGALRIVPPELESGLRREALADYTADAGRRILDNLELDAMHDGIDQWKELCDFVKTCPDPPGDELLARAQRLLADLDAQGVPQDRTDAAESP